MKKLEPNKTYLTNDGRKALCLGVTEDGRAAVAVDKRKMIETYSVDGTFRIDSDREADEGLHIAGPYVPLAGIWAVVNADGAVISTSDTTDGFSEHELIGTRTVWLQEVRDAI